MAEDTAHLDTLLGLLAESNSKPLAPEEHPDSDELFAYHANELSPEGNRQIREHLLACSRCRELLLDFDLFLQPPVEERPEGTVDLGAAAEWRDLWKLISAEPGALFAPFNRGKGWNFIVSPLAASLMAGLIVLPLLGMFGLVVYLGGENRQLRRQVADLREPQANVFHQVLESTRGEAPRLPAGRPLQWTFRTSAPQKYAEYTVEILSAEGQSIWSGALRKGQDGELTLALGPGFLEPGQYFVRLSGTQDGRSETLEDYTMRVVPP